MTNSIPPRRRFSGIRVRFIVSLALLAVTFVVFILHTGSAPCHIRPREPLPSLAPGETRSADFDQVQEWWVDINGRLYADHADVYAGAWVDGGFHNGIHFAVTDGGENLLLQYESARNLCDAGLMEVHEVEYSIPELNAAGRSVWAIVRRLNLRPGYVGGGGVDMRENRYYIDVFDPDHVESLLFEQGYGIPPQVELRGPDSITEEDISRTEGGAVTFNTPHDGTAIFVRKSAFHPTTKHGPSLAEYAAGSRRY